VRVRRVGGRGLVAVAVGVLHLARTGAGAKALVLEMDEMENVGRPDANVSGAGGGSAKAARWWMVDLAGIDGRDVGQRARQGAYSSSHS